MHLSKSFGLVFSGLHQFIIKHNFSGMDLCHYKSEVTSNRIADSPSHAPHSASWLNKGQFDYCCRYD